MNAFNASCLATIAALGLAGCASIADDYPSLAKRDAERLGGTALPVNIAPSPPTPPAPSPGLGPRIDHLVEMARAAHGRFEARRPAVSNLVAGASGAAVATDPWIAAQTELASLDTARSEAMIALAELDQLYADERLAYADGISPAARLLGEARDRVDVWVTEEDLVIERLAGSLR